MMPSSELDEHLDAILRAAGSGLRHYSMGSAREAMRKALQAALASRPTARAPAPQVFRDGDKWCALYGDDIMAGVCGLGDTPSDAVEDYLGAWYGNRALETPPPGGPVNLSSAVWSAVRSAVRAGVNVATSAYGREQENGAVDAIATLHSDKILAMIKKGAPCD